MALHKFPESLDACSGRKQTGEMSKVAKVKSKITMCLCVGLPKGRAGNKDLSLGVYLGGDSREQKWGTRRVKQGKRQSQSRGVLLMELNGVLLMELCGKGNSSPLGPPETQRELSTWRTEKAEAFTHYFPFHSGQGMPSVLVLSRKSRTNCVMKFIIINWLPWLWSLTSPKICWVS